MSINTVAISGNLTRDAESRATQSGTVVVSLSVAVNDRRKNPQTGEWEDVPNYVDVVQFCRSDKQANFFGHLQKGTKVSVQGRLHYSKWEKDGQTRSKLEVYADQLEVMSRDGQQSDGNAYLGRTYAPSAAPAPAPAAPMAPAPAPMEVYGEDIPF